ncbi:MAG: hydroxymethylglutaryl-CoA lyase [Candidatus Eisenbacteria bacterium]
MSTIPQAHAAGPWPVSARIVEVGPRDGLQNEATPIPAEARAKFALDLAAAGLTTIEVGAFVRPDRVPQMSGTEDVLAAIERGIAARAPGAADARFLVLVPNARGLERAVAAGARAIAVFTAASETFNQKNIGMGIDESLAAFEPIVREAKAKGLWVRGYLSTVFGCPYEGPIDPVRAANTAVRLWNLGVDEISLGDTIGVATPAGVGDVLGALGARIPRESTALHMHDTRGTALVNVMAGLLLGIRTFDASAGGLGGCPFAPGATGNAATEDVVYLLHGLGIQTGVDLPKLVAAAVPMEEALGRPLPGHVYQAWRRSPQISAMFSR